MTDDIDAYLEAHGYTRRMIRREKAWNVIAAILVGIVGIVGGLVVGAGVVAIFSGEAW